MSSFTVRAGSAGLATSTFGVLAISDTGWKSRCVSNGSFWRSSGVITKVAAIISSVWPSAGARATASVPRMVLAPGRFSTSTGWPKVSAARGAIERLNRSSTPPAGNGTISRTGLDG